jgi:hypothetical protein
MAYKMIAVPPDTYQRIDDLRDKHETFNSVLLRLYSKATGKAIPEEAITDGRKNKRRNVNGSNHSDTLQSTRQVAMPVAGGEVTFSDKPLKVCPADLKPDINARGCAFHLSGHCNRLSYPYGCRLNLSKEDWEALPTA